MILPEEIVLVAPIPIRAKTRGCWRQWNVLGDRRTWRRTKTHSRPSWEQVSIWPMNQPSPMNSPTPIIVPCPQVSSHCRMHRKRYAQKGSLRSHLPSLPSLSHASAYVGRMDIGGGVDGRDLISQRAHHEPSGLVPPHRQAPTSGESIIRDQSIISGSPDSHRVMGRCCQNLLE